MIYRGVNTEEYWNEKIKKNYDYNISEISYWKITKDIIIANNKYFLNKTLLDVGCADGKSLFYFNQYLPDWKYTGYDFSEEGINIANRYNNFDNIKFYKRDIILSPIDENFDIITIFETIEHISEEINYKVLDNLLEHCCWLFLSTVDTKDSCFGEHISHYDIDTLEKKGYPIRFKMYLDEIKMPNGIFHYFINLIEGKLP